MPQTIFYFQGQTPCIVVYTARDDDDNVTVKVQTIHDRKFVDVSPKELSLWPERPGVTKYLGKLPNGLMT